MKKIPWGPVRSSLTEHFSFSSIKKIVGYADFDMSSLAHLEQKSQGGASKSELLSAIDRQIGSMNLEAQGAVAAICCEEMLRLRPDLLDELERVLSRVGWKYSGANLLPIEIFDLEELTILPQQAHMDIEKAAVRLRNGDLSGSLAASCGAVDSVTAAIFQEFHIPDHGKASFQEKVKKSLTAIKSKETLEDELRSIQWSENDLGMTTANLIGSLNQASLVMQKLRSDMGDVHGTKPVVNALVYDSIKWASLILRILSARS